MVQDVSAPVSIAVIAVDVLPASGADAATQEGFEQTARRLGGVGAVIKGGGTDLMLTVALEPDTEVDMALNQLGSIVADFDEQYRTERLRILVHYGTAFRAIDASGRATFQGSAVRSVSNALKRSSLAGGVYATSDFAGYASGLKGVPAFEVLKAGGDGFSPLLLGDRPKIVANEIHSTDPELVDWLKARLARDLGPFAAPLIDNASHATRTAKELAAAVGHEIVDARARQRFDADVFKYLRSRGF